MQTQLRKFILVLFLSWLSALNNAIAEQECNEAILETAPAVRFTVNGDGTVTDRQTGLMWARCPQGLSGENCVGTLDVYDWADALALNQASSDTQNRDDWRLPNLKELFSLVEFACTFPAINVTVFPNNGSADSIFWSSSPIAASNDARTWSVDFGIGRGFALNRDSERPVRLVRGGAAQ